MSFLRIALLATILAACIACDSSNPSPAPMPSPVTSPADDGGGTATAPGTTGQRAPAVAPGQLERRVNMLDACEPDSFNAAVGAGTCVRSGGMRFDTFIDQLTRHGVVGPWRFSPSTASLREGVTLVAFNKGGEVHTLTEVEQFGGGIVPQLNTLAHVPDVAPECAALEEDDFVPPGGTYREEVTDSGTVRFQCCIHPWMRLETQVSDK